MPRRTVLRAWGKRHKMERLVRVLRLPLTCKQGKSIFTAHAEKAKADLSGWRLRNACLNTPHVHAKPPLPTIFAYAKAPAQTRHVRQSDKPKHLFDDIVTVTGGIVAGPTSFF